MNAKQFRSWRKAMELKRRQAALLLGVKKRDIRNYEKQPPKNDDPDLPKAIELACYALSRGVSEFDGKTAKNSFNGLGAAEDIEMIKPKSTSSKARIKSSK